jgi:hypothetical protein
MEEGSYSANGVKHCIRPCDMTGKSSAVILRQMHPIVVREASKYDQLVDLPMWLSSLSLEDSAMPYYQQKELECQALERAAPTRFSDDPGKKTSAPVPKKPPLSSVAKDTAEEETFCNE